jgi:CubicO group peptidase (beta-lactamase class C family)
VVVRDGRIVKAKGYGLSNVELKVSATTDTVYELASTTKPLLATAIMLLVQEGKLSLEDKINRYIDNPPEAWNEVTVHHLLSHTSGIPDYLSDLQHDFVNETPPREIVEFAAKAPLKFTPGERWSYSNTGYVILGMILDRITGETYDQLLAERVFDPLGMTSTRRDSAHELVPNRAAGYLWFGAGGLQNGDFLKYMMTNHGDRGILSTVLDLAKWGTALTGDRLLSKESLALIWTPARLADGSSASYGLGWFTDRIQGHRHISHPGGAPGSAANVSFYPDDGLMVVLLANGGAAYPQALDWGIAQKYIAGLMRKNVSTVAPAVLDAYCGFYDIFGGQLLKVTRKGNSLVLDDGGRLTNAFLPLSETKFVAEDADRSFAIDGGTIAFQLGDGTAKAYRIGPPATVSGPRIDPDPSLTARVERILKAFERGGKAVEEVPGVAPQARQDYARGPSPELRGIESLHFVAMHALSRVKTQRHGAEVARVAYYQMETREGRRLILVYFTANNEITDQDVVM